MEAHQRLSSVSYGEKMNIIYMIEAKIKKANMNVALKYSDIEIWHKRLGHISKKELETLARKRLLPSLADMSFKICVHCLPEKTHRVAFKSFFSI